MSNIKRMTRLRDLTLRISISCTTFRAMVVTIGYRCRTLFSEKRHPQCFKVYLIQEQPMYRINLQLASLITKPTTTTILTAITREKILFYVFPSKISTNLKWWTTEKMTKIIQMIQIFKRPLNSIQSVSWSTRIQLSKCQCRSRSTIFQNRFWLKMAIKLEFHRIKVKRELLAHHLNLSSFNRIKTVNRQDPSPEFHSRYHRSQPLSTCGENLLLSSIQGPKVADFISIIEWQPLVFRRRRRNFCSSTKLTWRTSKSMKTVRNLRKIRRWCMVIHNWPRRVIVLRTMSDVTSLKSDTSPPTCPRAPI